MTRRKRILVVDDDESLRRITQMQLQEAGYDVCTAADGQQALAMVGDFAPALVITDLKMPGMSGMELLARLRSECPETMVIMITAYGTIQNAVEAMKAGAYDYITKPIDYDELVLVVDRALERQQLAEEVQNLRAVLNEKYGFENIIGHSKALLRVLNIAARVAPTDSTVLIQGETGTGKELLAKAIYHNSRRKNKPFVTINCGAIPKDLLESELFGHVKGSFTGAIANRRGKVEMADGGTLFLDEVGELPLELQVKLLRLLQQGEIEKVGGTKPAVVDVRVIAATHRNLQAMIENGAFREDLYYRLAVIPLEIPPLRERVEDIPELVQHLFLNARRRHGKPDLKLPPALLPYFTAYRWPGNVRELENVLERLVVLSVGGEVTVDDLPDFLRRQPPPQEAVVLDLPPHGISLENVERELILRALEKFNWNQTQAAEYLDISRRTLIYRMEKHGLRREQVQDTAADG
ncbi:MAG TPA: sigma-54 dependent transcriptional regulator [Bryobacteraceae bacterium]|nr:sigma-54 dependent transcriptional regulator [Bryobacteraceae bacterium]HOQ43784.1 sigma-54 dependent transcriptional regulator [Bryobacteraceae bacterium]HPQ14894.1 sigma-54 dependent transcriptional regulator [Bryobacteraceae bacterium]HPU71773.1 sigma-54 dependent transcriptional regulator [Bryobacteraceae bacterium]